jgi:hypothetical protein
MKKELLALTSIDIQHVFHLKSNRDKRKQLSNFQPDKDQGLAASSSVSGPCMR